MRVRVEEHWSSITGRVIDPLLDAAGAERGARVVDLGTGSGDAAGGAVARGAIATGVDVAAAMVETAARRHPAAQFVQASATRLPFADGSFDAAVGNTSSSTSASPSERRSSLRECSSRGDASRCRRGDAPERSPFFATILGAVADADVPPPTGIPAGPSFFQFADDVVFAALLSDAGFTEVEVDAISLRLRSLGEGSDRRARRGHRLAPAHSCEPPTRRKVWSSASRWRCGGAVATPGGVCRPGVDQDRKRT